jgi:hypothetical protein
LINTASTTFGFNGTGDFVVLPAVSPTFVNLMPYSVSLISKLLFGLAAAETLRRYSYAGSDHAAVPGDLTKTLLGG